MKDSLMIVEGSNGFNLQWYLAEEDDMGSNLGEMHKDEESYIRDCEPDERAAYLSAKGSLGATHTCQGLEWETKALANAALKGVKAAWKEMEAAEKAKGDKGLLLTRVFVVAAACKEAGVTLAEVEKALKQVYP